MLAVYCNINPIGWVTCKWLRFFWPGCLRSRLNGLSLKTDAPKPQLPGEDWVLVRTVMGGICGSDVAILAQKQPPNSILQAFTSFPLVLGHENVAIVEETGPAVDSSWVGKRVCVEPTLCCEPRGIEPLCPRCRAGQFGACDNFASDEGSAKLPPGTSIGYNSRTGGSFGEYFVAHKSQLVEVPDQLSDEQAVLTDPLACSLHAVLKTDYASAKRILVYGGGVLGLGIITSLRAVGFAGEIHVIERAGYLEPVARRLGADEFVRLPDDAKQRFETVAELTGGKVHAVRFGNYMLSGGYDVVFDCVGSPQAINECLKWSCNRGQVVMVATGHGGKLDITPLWFSELTFSGSYGRSIETFAGRRLGTYQLVHELMVNGKLDVRGFLTHTFGLKNYRRAFETAMNKGRHEAIKVAFDFR